MAQSTPPSGTTATASGGSATLTWTNPTQRTDGTALASSEIAGTVIDYSLCVSGAVSSTPQTVTAMGSVTTYTITGLEAGTWCFEAETKDTNGLVSAPSNVASKTIGAAAPASPAKLTVQLSDTTAYKLRESIDGLAFVAIGTLPAGTQCDGSHDLEGYSLVPRAAVTLSSPFDTLPLVAFAHCAQ